MASYQVGLLTTFILGIFIIIGALIALWMGKKDYIVDFSIGLAFGVITTLILTDLLPEIFDSFGFSRIYVPILFTIVGFVILKVLDSFIPDHHDHHMSKKESKENLTHIGMITTLTLVLHNIIEGMAVYSSALSNPSLGVALTIGVGFHNIPLGMVIASSFYNGGKDLKKTILSIGIVSLSTFLGGCIMSLLHLTVISEILLGILLSCTLGMLLFIIADELFPRIYNTKKRKFIYSGIVVGVISLLLALLVG